MKAALEHFGFQMGLGIPQPMVYPHWHHEIELNYVEQGALSYLFGSEKLRLTRGDFAVFWGTIPHQVVAVGPETRFRWLTLPLRWFLDWQLSSALSEQVLRGKPVVDNQMAVFDRLLFERWQLDLQLDDAEQIVQLEVHARLRRLALLQRNTPPAKTLQVLSTSANISSAERMALFIATHYRETLSVSDIAHDANLHPNYAMKIFRDTFGESLLTCLLRHRIAHAQRLLVMSTLPVLDVALESGFGSLSRFYAAFNQACGQSPRQYRLSMQRVKQTRDDELPSRE